MQLLAWIFTGLRRLLGLLLLLGPTPRHVAFIMDGNRRFASSRHVDKITGHKRGYSKMIDVVHWCLELGVPCISVYAFSIDNFNRSSDEVAALMQLAEEKYAELSQEHGLAEREGIEMRVLGDLSLAPGSVQGAAARMMQATAKLRSKRAVLNICFSYIATEEVVQAVDAIQHAVHLGTLQPSDVCPSLLDACMHTHDCPPVDLLIRTSGETRLSEFLLWQSRGARLKFIERMWPDFGFLDWARCVLGYQRGAALQQQLRRQCVDAQEAGGTGREADAAPAARPARYEAAAGAQQDAAGCSGGRREAAPSSFIQRTGAAALLVLAWKALLWACTCVWLLMEQRLGHRSPLLPSPSPLGSQSVSRPQGAASGAVNAAGQLQQEQGQAGRWTADDAGQRSVREAEAHAGFPHCGLEQQQQQQQQPRGSLSSQGGRTSEFLRRRDAERRDWIEAHVGCT